MYQNPFTANVYPRIVFTSNDRDILRSIVGHRDLTDDDIRAIELRLLSIRVTAAAREFLTGHGNYSFTAGWVHGKQTSKYVLANHIRFLYENRRPSKNSSGRLLVEGEVDTTLVRGMRLRSASAQTVLKALVKMLESPGPQRPGLHITEDGRVWITPSGLVQFVDGALVGKWEPITLPRAGQVLRQFASQELSEQRVNKTCPPGAQRGRWIEVDLGLLFEESERYGMQNERIERLLRTQPDGNLKVEMAKAHLEPLSND
jgi:hypothetical protein